MQEEQDEEETFEALREKHRRRWQEEERAFERDWNWIANIVAYTTVACIAVILIGLAVNIPWLGVPLLIVVGVWYFLSIVIRYVFR